MPKKRTKKPKLASWSKHGHPSNLGAELFYTNIPSLYGTDIFVSTFPDKKVLDIGEVLQGERVNFDYIASVDLSNFRRIYAVPNSKADASLSLLCDGDCGPWEANSAYFKDGKLVAIISKISITNIEEGVSLPRLMKNKYSDPLSLIDIYKLEIDRVAREVINYKDKANPFFEMVKIIKAKSPQGKGLHNSYRDAIKEVITR